MKRFFRALAFGLFVLVIAQSVNAQGKHEIFAGAGVGSERALATRGIWKSRLVGTGSTTVRSSGVYHLGYRFLNKKQIALGLSATAESMDVIRTGAPMPDFWGSTAESKDTHIALLLDCRYQWGGRSNTNWYSGAAPGIGWYKRKEIHNDFSTVKEEFSKIRFAYHVTALGFGFGNKVGGYVELGYGVKGILSAGVKWKP